MDSEVVKVTPMESIWVENGVLHQVIRRFGAPNIERSYALAQVVKMDWRDPTLLRGGKLRLKTPKGWSPRIKWPPRRQQEMQELRKTIEAAVGVA